MVVFKNSTLSISPIKQAELPDRTLDNPAALTPWVCDGYLEHLTPGEAYMSYGVQLSNPATAQIEVSDFLAAAVMNGFVNAAFEIAPGSVGNPTCLNLSADGAMEGTYTLTMIDPLHFGLLLPSSVPEQVGDIGQPYGGGGLSFTLEEGPTACVAGDTFTITVSPNGGLFATYMAKGQVTVAGAVNGQGSTTGNVYRIIGRPTVFDDGLPADHVFLMLNELMEAIGAPKGTE